MYFLKYVCMSIKRGNLVYEMMQKRLFCGVHCAFLNFFLRFISFLNIFLFSRFQNRLKFSVGTENNFFHIKIRKLSNIDVMFFHETPLWTIQDSCLPSYILIAS